MNFSISQVTCFAACHFPFCLQCDNAYAFRISSLTLIRGTETDLASTLSGRQYNFANPIILRNSTLVNNIRYRNWCIHKQHKDKSFVESRGPSKHPQVEATPKERLHTVEEYIDKLE